MQIDFYNNISDNRKVNKNITFLQSINANLKHDSNKTNLYITIKESDMINTNYVYVPEYNRYYFIQTETHLQGGLLMLHLLEDVLQTYAQYILTLFTLVTRQERVYDKYQIDDKYPVRVKRSIECVQCGTIGNPISNNIVLTVCGVD